MRVAIAGGAGYIGGELLRLALGHPRMELAQASSDRFQSQPIHAVHPNLRGRSRLEFVPHDSLRPCDVLFLCVPHGRSMDGWDRWRAIAPTVVDLSADFRLRDPAAYPKHYGRSHPHPEWLDRFVPGIPELHRGRLVGATHISVPGCMANAAILALFPLAEAGLIEGEAILDARTGSSGSGATESAGSLHSERSGVMRVYQPFGHRHEPEIAQACGVGVRMSATAVEAVRGVQIVARVRLARRSSMKDFWGIYRSRYQSEAFIRIVAQKTGLYRLPEPKILSGTNYCDVGFAVEADGEFAVVIAALDNLVKGGAGNAIQCLNIASGFSECDGLEFAGLHPL